MRFSPTVTRFAPSIFLEQCLRFARGSGRPTLEASGLVTLGTMLLAQGQLSAAKQNLQRGVDLARDLGDAISYANGLVQLGACLIKSGEVSEGMRYLVDGDGAAGCQRAELADGEKAARRYLEELSTNMPAMS